MRVLGTAALGFCVFAASVVAGPLGYANTSGGQFGVVDLTSGAFSPVGGLATSLIGLGASGGVLYGLDSSGNLVTIDPATAATVQLGNVGISNVTTFTSLTTGALYAVDSSWMLWSINPATVMAISIGSINVNNTALPSRNGHGYANSLAGNATSLYFTLDLWNNTPGDVLADTLYRINPASGAATVIGTTNQEDIAGAAFVGGTLYGFTGNFGPLPHNIVTLDPTTGAATFQTNVAAGINTLYGAVDAAALTTSSETAIPEPGTVSLAALALAVGCFVRRRTERAALRRS